MTNECLYCNEIKEVRLWKQTDELVCYDCRVSLLDQEFNIEKTTYKMPWFEEDPFANFPSIRK